MRTRKCGVCSACTRQRRRGGRGSSRLTQVLRQERRVRDEELDDADGCGCGGRRTGLGVVLPTSGAEDPPGLEEAELGAVEGVCCRKGVSRSSCLLSLFLPIIHAFILLPFLARTVTSLLACFPSNSTTFPSNKRASSLLLLPLAQACSRCTVLEI